MPSEKPDSKPPLDGVDGFASVNMMTTSSFSGAKCSTDADVSLPGRLQDRYVFRSLLGIGGFGAVFEAWDELLHRAVAIKLARRDRFGGTKGRLRFLDEARAAAKLKHPNIVTVFDSGSDADGNPFVVFELITGESLFDRIKRQPLSQSEALSILILVAEAVHMAHKEGLVHRDLKPQNILLDAADQPHVTDFGLAVDERTQREQAGEVAGSPQYMSPEQMRGETEYLDGRTDIWSLGVLLYELLAHRRPFTGRTFDEIRGEILHREPKPLRQLDEKISVELEAVCLRCLKKEVSDRWSSAADFAKRLQDLMTPPANLASGMQVRHRLLIVAAVLSLICGLVVALRYPSDRAASPPDGPVSPPVRNSVTTDPGSPASTDSQHDAPEPIPGKWFPLLSRTPEYLVWPSDERNSKREHNVIGRELWLTCNEGGLVKLGEATKDFEIQLQLHQAPWTGNVGLFFGLREESEAGVRVRQYQFIELSCPRDRKGERAFLSRVTMTRHGKHVKSRGTPVTVAIPVLTNQDTSLRVRVAGGRLAAVRWNGVVIPELVADSLDAMFPASAQHGGFGIVVEQSSVVIRHAELLFPSESSQ